jgi:hypothetical protein
MCRSYVLVLATVAGAVVAGCGVPTFGPFTPAAPMNEARVLHACAVLPDGRVLVAGGVTNVLFVAGLPLRSAEVYDPGADAWRPTGSMATARFFHTMTTLGDGTVLVAGGTRDPLDLRGAALATAERYDPATGTFASVGSMTEPRLQHTATRLSDGRALIVGGRAATAELFDPVSQQFRRTAGSMRSVRRGHTATRLADGRVLIASGGDAVGEIFDPATERFTPTANAMSLSVDDQAAVRLADGRVLLAGGQRLDDGVTVNQTWLFDPQTGRFDEGPQLTVGPGLGVQDLMAVDLFAGDERLGGTYILLAGGEHDPGAGRGPDINLDYAQLYDGVTHTLTDVGPMLWTHDDFCAASLPADEAGRPRVLLIGGHDARDRARSDCEIFTLPVGFGPGDLDGDDDADPADEAGLAAAWSRMVGAAPDRGLLESVARRIGLGRPRAPATQVVPATMPAFRRK